MQLHGRGLLYQCISRDQMPRNRQPQPQPPPQQQLQRRFSRIMLQHQRIRPPGWA